MTRAKATPWLGDFSPSGLVAALATALLDHLVVGCSTSFCQPDFLYEGSHDLLASAALLASHPAVDVRRLCHLRGPEW